MFSLAPRKSRSLLIVTALLLFIAVFTFVVGNNAAVPANFAYQIHGCTFPLNPQLAPDRNEEGYRIEITNVQTPAHGTTSRGEGNGVNYCPDYGYVGEDSFGYTVCVIRPEGPSCGSGLATLNVVNQAPNGVADTFNVHGSTVIGPFLANDSDPDGDPVTCGDAQHECIITFPRHGGLFGLQETDKKSYRPTFGYIGADSLTYNACDGLGICVPTTVNLNVNNNPPIAGNDSYPVPDGPTVIGPFLANDSDPDGDPLGSPEILTFPQHGSLSGLAQPDRKFYSPHFGFAGTDIFTYRICDDLGACSTATVTLQVGAAPTPTPTPTSTPTPPPPPPPPPPTPSPSPSPTPVEPLIFIPGIAGSHLVDRTNNAELWPGLGTFHDSLSLDPADNPNPNIIATDVIRRIQTLFGVTLKTVYAPLLEDLTNASRGGFREYQVNNNPTRRTSAGCDLSQRSDDPASNPSLFVFAYDWRKGNKQNADSLADYVGCIQKFYPDRNVNILAHSMGGVLARRYILDNPGKVKKLITIATPWIGAPKGIYVLETGEAGFNFLLIWRSTLRRLSRFFPAIHELMPSKAYYDIGGLPFAERGDFNRNGIPDEIYSYTQQTNLLDSRYPHEGSRPGSTNEIFHQFPGEDDWRTDNSGVEYHHIFGEQRRNHTIGQVVVQRVPQCIHEGDLCFDKEVFFPIVTNGDGTVTKRSATRRGVMNGAPSSLNARDATLWYLFTPDDPNEEVIEANDQLVEHNGLTHFGRVKDLVLFLLNKGPDPGIPFHTARQMDKLDRGKFPVQLASGRKSGGASRSSNLMAHSKRRSYPGSRANYRPTGSGTSSPHYGTSATQITSDEIPDSPKAPAYYVTVMGVDFVSVSDDAGNANTQLDDMFALPVPNVSYRLIGDQAVFISMPASKTYTMTFRVGASPITLEILKGFDNVTPTDAVRYRDIVLPEGVTAMLRVTPSGIENLRYDSESDGVFETPVTPTVSLSGQLAADVTPPTVTISGEAQETKVRVTISAQDNESGSNGIRYSLDGLHYQPYTAPLLVEPLQNRTVYAFADDQAANRSALVDYSVPQPPTITAPASVIIDTDPSGNSCGGNVSDGALGTPNAVSNSQGTVALTRTGVPANNFFPVGRTAITYTARDSNGLIATATQDVTVIDKTPPTLSRPENIVALLPFNSTATSTVVNYSIPAATDNCSQSVLVTSVPASGSVFSVGTSTVVASASDAAGNSSSTSFTVTVMYNFGGFFPPVNNVPVLNLVNAGRAIPIKFGLAGNKGLAVFSMVSNNPGSGSIACDSTATEVDLTETLTAGNSSLSYDPQYDQYTYVWKTDSSWVGTCRQFVMQLNDGSLHRANFKFR